MDNLIKSLKSYRDKNGLSQMQMAEYGFKRFVREDVKKDPLKCASLRGIEGVIDANILI